LNGFLIVDKPKGPSSFDIIRMARRAAGIRKIGHNGTLDPDATGLLILALGKATRLLPYLQSEPKIYEFSIQFGTATDTLDSAGAITEQNRPIPSVKALAGAVGSFQGAILQTPPHYCAVKVKGKPAYTLARQNKAFNLPPRHITIHSLDILDYNEEKGVAALRASCSKGTYIRSLARDIAQRVETAGYASSIRRVAAGIFTLQDAASMESIEADACSYIIPVEKALASYPSHTASPLQVKDLSHGNAIEVDTIIGSPILFIYSPEKELIAVAERRSRSMYHPIKVFIEP
jgi:tRNA pseudouridine55 synthase